MVKNFKKVIICKKCKTVLGNFNTTIESIEIPEVVCSKCNWNETYEQNKEMYEEMNMKIY